MAVTSRTLRFRFHLARQMQVSPPPCEAQVVGEHGASQVFLWPSIATKPRSMPTAIAQASQVAGHELDAVGEVIQRQRNERYADGANRYRCAGLAAQRLELATLQGGRERIASHCATDPVARRSLGSAEERDGSIGLD